MATIDHWKAITYYMTLWLAFLFGSVQSFSARESSLSPCSSFSLSLCGSVLCYLLFMDFLLLLFVICIIGSVLVDNVKCQINEMQGFCGIIDWLLSKKKRSEKEKERNNPWKSINNFWI
jgi:hypothetical protein